MGAAQSGFLSLIPLAIALIGPTVDPPSLGPGYTAALQLHRVQPLRHRSLVPKRFAPSSSSDNSDMFGLWLLHVCP